MIRQRLSASMQRLRGKHRYNESSLRNLYTEMLKNLQIDERNEAKMVELVRQAAEMIVYGEQNGLPLFEYFCEKNMLALLVDLMATGSNAVRVQVLQTLGILVQNVQDQRNLYYILSNNHINELIDLSIMSLPEEVLAQYASFIKTLGLRLDAATVQFFFDHRARRFGIFGKAMQLMAASREPMIQMAGLTTILTTVRIADERLQQWMDTRAVLGRFLDLMRNNAFVAVKDFNELLGDKAFHSTAIGPTGAAPLSSSLAETVRSARNRLHGKAETLQDQFIVFEDVLNAATGSPNEVHLRHATRHFLLHHVLMPLLMNFGLLEGAIAAAEDARGVFQIALELANTQEREEAAEEQALAAELSAAEAAYECVKICNLALLAVQATICVFVSSDDSALLHTLSTLLFSPDQITAAQPKMPLEEMLKFSDRRIKRSRHMEADKLDELDADLLEFRNGCGFSHDTLLEAREERGSSVWALYSAALRCSQTGVFTPSPLPQGSAEEGRRLGWTEASNGVAAAAAENGEQADASKAGLEGEMMEMPNESPKSPESPEPPNLPESTESPNLPESTESTELKGTGQEWIGLKVQSRVISAAYVAAACLAVAKCRNDEGLDVRVLHALGFVALNPVAGLSTSSQLSGMFEGRLSMKQEAAEGATALKSSSADAESDTATTLESKPAPSDSLEACLEWFEGDSWSDDILDGLNFSESAIIQSALGLVENAVVVAGNDREELLDPGEGDVQELALRCALSLLLEIVLVQTDHIQHKWRSSVSLSLSDPVYIQFSRLSKAIFHCLGLAAAQVCDFLGSSEIGDSIHVLVSAMLSEAQSMLPRSLRSFALSSTGTPYNKDLLGAGALRRFVADGTLLRAAAGAAVFAAVETAATRRGASSTSRGDENQKASETVGEGSEQARRARCMMRRLVLLWQVSRALLLEDPENQFGFHADLSGDFETADANFVNLLYGGDEFLRADDAVNPSMNGRKKQDTARNRNDAAAKVHALVLSGPALDKAEELGQTLQQTMRKSAVTSPTVPKSVQATCVLGSKTFQLLLLQRDHLGEQMELWRTEIENTDVAFDRRGTRCLQVFSKSDLTNQSELTSLAFDTEKSCRVVKRHLEKHKARIRSMQVQILCEVTKELSRMRES